MRTLPDYERRMARSAIAREDVTLMASAEADAERPAPEDVIYLVLDARTSRSGDGVEEKSGDREKAVTQLRY